MADLTLAHRLKQLRESLGLKINEAADRLGFGSYQTLSNIENGEREVKVQELQKFSKVYYSSIDKLLGKSELDTSTKFLWRSSPKERKQEIESEILYHCEQYKLLESLLEVKTKEGFITVSLEDINTNYRIMMLADNISKLLQLGRRPAFTLQKVLEQDYGVKILYYSFSDGSSVSTVNKGLGKVIVINSNEAPWRQNYDLAHELFHLITWDAVVSNNLLTEDEYNEDLERKANLFASILLLPESEVRKEILDRVDNQGRINDSDIVDVAIEFGVSTQALIYRLTHMKLISFDKASTITKDVELREVDKRKRFLERMKSQKPEQYAILAIRCLRKGLLSRGKFAEMMEIDRSHIDDFINDKGLMEQEGSPIEIMAS